MERKFKAKGTLRYGTKSWWLVLDVPEEIPEYYRWFVRREVFPAVLRSKFGAHITVIEGKSEEPTIKEPWGRHAGEEVEFWYSEVGRNRLYVWLEVESSRLVEIRAELGLPPRNVGFHLTVARLNKRPLVLTSVRHKILREYHLDKL